MNACGLHVLNLTLCDPGYLRKLPPPPPLPSPKISKLLYQLSPYHSCAFAQVFDACSSWSF